MGFVDTNWDDVSTSNVIPVGYYSVQIAEQEQREGAKAPYINWTLTVDGVLSVDDPEKAMEASKAVESGRKLFLNTSLAQNSLWRLKRFIAAATGSMPTGTGFDPDSLIGMRVKVKVTIKQYEGEDRNDVGEVTKLV